MSASGNDRPVTFPVHRTAWTLGVGRLVELGGGRKAAPEAAAQAVLAPVDPASAESPEQLARTVQDRRQGRLNELVRNRVPLIG